MPSSQNARPDGNTSSPDFSLGASKSGTTQTEVYVTYMPTPLEIKKTGPNEITVRWDDGHVSTYPIQYLRAECMCANCVSEVTGLRILDPRTVAEDLTVLSAEHVGRYGVKFMFSDRHDDGIYTWERLRSLCLCEECKKAAPAEK